MGKLEDIAAVLRSGRLTTTTLADSSGVLLDVDGLKVHSLNETGMFLVQAIGEGASEEELVERLLAAYDIDRPSAVRDIQAFLATLHTCLAGATARTIER